MTTAVNALLFFPWLLSRIRRMAAPKPTDDPSLRPVRPICPPHWIHLSMCHLGEHSRDSVWPRHDPLPESKIEGFFGRNKQVNIETKPYFCRLLDVQQGNHRSSAALVRAILSHSRKYPAVIPLNEKEKTRARKNGSNGGPVTVDDNLITWMNTVRNPTERGPCTFFLLRLWTKKYARLALLWQPFWPTDWLPDSSINAKDLPQWTKKGRGGFFSDYSRTGRAVMGKGGPCQGSLRTPEVSHLFFTMSPSLYFCIFSKATSTKWATPSLSLSLVYILFDSVQIIDRLSLDNQLRLS